MSVALEGKDVIKPDNKLIIDKKILTLGIIELTFDQTTPDFYNELINSFRIKNLPTHFTEFDIVVSGNNERLRGVKVTAVSGKGEMVQFSNPIGEIELKEFESGWWDLTFECPGFVTEEKKSVKAELGKKTEMKIELVKVT